MEEAANFDEKQKLFWRELKNASFLDGTVRSGENDRCRPLMVF